MKRMNMCLDSIIPGCTSYYARHSVASIVAQMARECMIDAGEGDASMQFIGSDGKIYPNATI